MTPTNLTKVGPPLLFLAAAVAGCAFPHEVEILHSPPAVRYITIKTIIYQQAYAGYPNDDILKMLSLQAGKVGADAVILTDRHVSREFHHQYGLQETAVEYATGIAIRYPESGQDAAPTKDALRSPGAPAFSLSEAPPASALSVARADPLPQAKAEAPTMLGAFTVSERPVQSFGFSIRIIRDSITHQVEQITVDRVTPDSPAAAAGLGPLTSIRKINDKPVEEYLGSLERGSELFKLLMNRKSGDQITLEVLDMASTVPRVVTLTQRSVNVNAQNLEGFRMSTTTSTNDRLSPDEGHAR